jgi:hypothetical protein
MQDGAGADAGKIVVWSVIGVIFFACLVVPKKREPTPSRNIETHMRQETQMERARREETDRIATLMNEVREDYNRNPGAYGR